MKKISLVSLVLILAIASLFSDNVKALGSSFSLLIPDNYEDVKHFPDRLALQTTRYAEVLTNYGPENSTFLGLSPYSGNFITRHDLAFKAYSTNSTDYDRTYYKQQEFFELTNYFAYDFGSFSLGILAGIKLSNNDYESRKISERVDWGHTYFNERSDEDYKADNDIVLGVSSGFGEDNSLSIGFLYTYDYFDEYDRGKSLTEFTHDDTLYDFSSNINLYSDDHYNYSYQLSIIKDFGDENQSRILTKLCYTTVDTWVEEYYKRRNKYDFGDYIYEDITMKDNEYIGEKYSVLFGYGTSKQINNFRLFSGASLSAELEDLENDYRFTDIEQQIYPDSIEVISLTTVGYNEIRTYSSELSIPLGFSYKIVSWMKVMGSISISAEYQYIDSSDIDLIRDNSWNSKATQNISLEFCPTQKIEFGIYNIGTLSQYKNWEVMAKYSF